MDRRTGGVRMRDGMYRLIGALTLVVIIALGLPMPSALSQSSDTSPTLTAEGTISYAPGAGAVLVDPDLTIAGGEGAMLDVAIVSIGAGFVPAEDQLGIRGRPGTSGTVGSVLWSYDTARGVLTFTGTATLFDYQVALRRVAFSNSSPNPMATDRSVSISLGSAAYYPENGHFYEFVSDPLVLWTDAKPAAEARTYAGRQGYLVTVTTAGENDFITDKVGGSGWMGSSDAGHDKLWYWETGPEAGTHFFTQATNATGCGVGPAVTQPEGDYYENWDTIVAPEPNDFPDGCTDNENYGNFDASGLWNDWPDDSARQAAGYVVEYGGVAGEDTTAPVGTVLIQADTPSIAIATTWAGGDPDLAISFTVTPEVDGCTAEQAVSLPAGQASVDVAVLEDVGGTACTYTVTQATPEGYTGAPDEVTGVAVGGTAAFTNTQLPTGASPLPTTGAHSAALGIVGIAVAGAGSFLVGGGRRREASDSTDGAEGAEPVDLLPKNPWTRQAFAPQILRLITSESALADAPERPDPEPDTNTEAATNTDGDDLTQIISEPGIAGGYALVDDLLRLLDDLAEG